MARTPSVVLAAVLVLLACVLLARSTAASRHSEGIDLPVTPRPSFKELATAKGRQLLQADTCALQVCFAIDRSSSITDASGGTQNWRDTLQFVRDVVNGIEAITPSVSQYGASTYSTYGAIVSPLTTASGFTTAFNAAIPTSLTGTGGTGTCTTGSSCLLSVPGSSDETEFTNTEGGLGLCFVPPGTRAPGIGSGDGNGILNEGNEPASAETVRVVIHLTDGRPNTRYFRTHTPIDNSLTRAVDPPGDCPDRTVSCTNTDGSCPNPKIGGLDPDSICNQAGTDSALTGQTCRTGTTPNDCASATTVARSRAMRLLDTSGQPIANPDRPDITVFGIGIGSGASLGPGATFLESISDDFISVNSFGELDDILASLISSACCAAKTKFEGPEGQCWPDTAGSPVRALGNYKITTTTCAQPAGRTITFTLGDITPSPTPTPPGRLAAITCSGAANTCVQNSADPNEYTCTFAAAIPANTEVTCPVTVNDVGLTSYKLTVATNLDASSVQMSQTTIVTTWGLQQVCNVGQVSTGPTGTPVCGCRDLSCNPCPASAPDVFLATSDKGSWPNSIWVVKSFSPGSARSAEYVCRLRASTSTTDGITPGAFIGDIAFLWEGSLLVVDTAGRIGFVPKASLDNLVSSSVNSGITDIQGINQAGSTFSTRVCPYKRITGAAPGGTTGIANGFDSSEYVLSTFSGAVSKFRITTTQTSGALTTSSVLTATFSGTGTASATIPPSPFSSASGAAGTDVVAGPLIGTDPPKRFFRWVSANNADITTQGSSGTDWATQAMHYSGTRLNAATLASEGYVSWGTANGATPAPVIKPGGCSLPGDPTFGNNPACMTSTSGTVAADTPYAQSNFKNAGAFCTSNTVFGTAFCNPERQVGNGWAFTNYACNGLRSATNNPGDLDDVTAAQATEWEVARFFEFGVRGGADTTPVTTPAAGSPAPVFGGTTGVPPTAVATATIKTRLPLFVIGAATAPSCS